ncbi:uncharacterized protein LOC119072719 isoform X2 [Bradysia coprophila]|uniref:uncharacterized protein LOC119072719 isoform X2 n=1 Tax=Bradysia coprophila TaxID=38358 RepID=UPI00187D6FAA|nr:uncharacterized protein LOC119072719 isoform X2 [Bradysia coprophila]
MTIQHWIKKMFAPRNSSPVQLFTSDEIAAYQIKLKKVLGLTVCSNAALDVSPTTGVLAYPAGCTVVLFNSKKLNQSYLLNTSRKAITAIAYSQCGRYIATGECGQNPAIKVWELDTTNGKAESGTTGGTMVAEFLGHKYAISCIAFSPTGKYLVSVGSQHDMIVNVFDWKSNLKIASNKVSAKVVDVCFSEDGSYFVTVGNRHVKYWYLEGSRKYKEPIPLMGRSAILGELRNNDFCAVACGKGDAADSTYAITRNGHLVEFNSRRLLDKWVACRTTSANCLCISSKYILVGCAESIIRVFSAETLEYLTTLPRTHYLGADVAQGTHISHITAVPPNAKFPDTIAMVFDEPRSRVSCVYNDHSLYIWDLRDIRRVGKSHSFLYHSACIWGVETVPSHNYLKTNVSNKLPLDCFLTCSSDDTIRVWGLDDCENNEIYRRNIYSKELLKVLYIDDELNYIKDVDNPILNMEKPSSYDGRNGVRCIKISPDHIHLATGDRSGNIRIFNLENLKLITTIEAHDSEVLCLEYTSEKIDRKLLASASRDRLIHIFDVENSYQILQTLDDHSSSITSVKFIAGISGSAFQMVSCGADKSIIFRTFQQNQFLRGNNCSGKNTLYDMEIDSNSKHILTACQDRNIRIYGTQNAKHTKTFKGSHSDEGSLIKLCLDLSGIYIATSCTDKTLSVYDYYSTECMARMYGHSELVTGLKFTNDCRHLISASGDGCLFIWDVPHDMMVTMQARLSQQALRSGHPSVPRHISQSTASDESLTPHADTFGSPPNFLDDLPNKPGYRFSDVGQLPQWAKKKTNDDSPPPSANVLSSSPSQSQMFNTTDDEDEGSTPSGDNAERSLASTLGGSSESIPQQSSSSFLQAALDGPGALSDRGERSRRSISAKHNTDNKNSSYSKSFSNTKKEELMKVINEAKQKLENADSYRSAGKKLKTIHEVGYRSNLRASQSIADLSRSSHVDNSLAGRLQRTGDNNKTHANYLNCAAPKSVLTHNCNIVRQLQRDYPPYPCEIGLYHNASTAHSLPQKAQPPLPSTKSSTRPNTLELPNLDQVSTTSNKPTVLPIKGQKHPSILKHYKSCPVSPVHEEVDWSSFAAANQVGNKITVTEPPKRHSMYHEDAKTILDMIHNDTEKMIAEITEKYGDLDDFDPKRSFIPKSNSTGDMLKPRYSKSTLQDNEYFDNDDGNFSSDSLEDCSLDLDVPNFDRRKATKSVCPKHNRRNDQPTTLPKRSSSDYFIYEDFGFATYRNVSLSDILNDDNEPKDNSLFNSHQRHSSASFFLSGDCNKKSQESLLSDEYSIGGAEGVSYCNSMESILSDDSECKSAPLEALFIRTKREILGSYATANNESRTVELASKSYGSSPNATSGFDYYMQTYDMSGYGYETLLDNQVGSDSSRTLNPKPFATNTVTSSPTFPWLSTAAPTSKIDEFIPRLTSNNYSSSVNKSLSKEFANHRQNCKTNPIFECADERSSQKKMPSQPKTVKRIDIFKDPSVYVMKKSCSFDIDMFDGRRTQRSTKKYEQNLEKFEKERKMSGQYGGTLEMDYVPHKPPPAKNRRSSSVKSKRSLRDKDRYHTVGNCETNVQQSDKPSDEKSFDVYVAEKGVTEDENVDHLKLYDKPVVPKDSSAELFDQLHEKRDGIDDGSVLNSKFLSQSEYLKFQDIEKKIDVINKLVELEEKKLEHERILKENRMKPFQCNSKEKGYVKSLTMNFDNLAKTLQYENDYVLTQRQFEQRMKRNFSLPDVLEGAKLQLCELNIDDNSNQQFENALSLEGVRTSAFYLLQFLLIFSVIVVLHDLFNAA